MSLLLLPAEILLKILKFCQIKDLPNIKRTCRRFNETTNLESFWSFKCFKDYNISCKGRYFKTFKELYSVLLHRYGHLIGTYKYKFFSHGGLLEIEFQDGINAWLYRQNLRDGKNSLTKDLMFKIEKDPTESKVNILCCLETKNPHNGNLKKSMQGRRYIFQCGERYAIRDFHDGHKTLYGCSFIFDAFLNHGVELFPIFIQDVDDVPKSLIEYGEFPSYLVKPGLYRAVHKIRQDLIILLTYTENFKINGFLVSSSYGFGSNNVFRVNSIRKLGNYSNIGLEINDFEANFLPSLKNLSNSYSEIFSGKCKCWFKCFSKIIGSSDFTEAYLLVYDHDHFLVYEPAFVKFKFFERICQSFNKKRGLCIYDNL